MSQTIKTDVVVLGGGPGGYTAAFRAADLGLSVCLIEQQTRLGGVCLNVGCIPSKTLLHAAAVIEEAEEAGEFGVSFSAPQVDVNALRTHKEKIVKQLTGGLASLCKARKITRLKGRGMFSAPGVMHVEGEEPAEIQFTHAIIATGSAPFQLPGIPEDERIWDSTDALALKEIPKRLLIIGGGIISLEMAQIYHALGSSITIVEMLDHIIPPADKDMIQPLFLKLKKKYKIFTKTRVDTITAKESGIQVTFADNPKLTQDEYDAVLVAIGRRPTTRNIGLEALGIALDEGGFIPVNERQETSAPHIYAIGDVVGNPMLAHKATHQGKVAAEIIAGHKAAFTPVTIPSVAYTNPEIAWAGLTEKEAKKQGIAYTKGKFPWGASGRALSSGAGAGVSKVLFAKDSGRLIGAAVCGLNGGELIHEAVLALEMGADAEDISKTIHAHPTLAETFAFAAEIVDGSITDIMPSKK